MGRGNPAASLLHGDDAMIKHNDVMVRHTEYGPSALISKQNAYGLNHWEMFITNYSDYLIGRTPPNYPVPSIYCLSLISNLCDQRSNDVAMIGFMAWWYITNAEASQ